MLHVIDVHQRQFFAFRPRPFCKGAFALLFGEARPSRKSGDMVSPVRNGSHRPDPNCRAAKPSILAQLTSKIPWCVTLRAFCDFLHQVSAALDLRLRILVRLSASTDVAPIPRPRSESAGVDDLVANAPMVTNIAVPMTRTQSSLSMKTSLYISGLVAFERRPTAR